MKLFRILTIVCVFGFCIAGCVNAVANGSSSDTSVSDPGNADSFSREPVLPLLPDPPDRYVIPDQKYLDELDRLIDDLEKDIQDMEAGEKKAEKGSCLRVKPGQDGSVRGVINLGSASVCA